MLQSWSYLDFNWSGGGGGEITRGFINQDFLSLHEVAQKIQLLPKGFIFGDRRKCESFVDGNDFDQMASQRPFSFG